MRDSAGKLPDGFDLLSMAKLRLGLDAAGDLGFQRGCAFLHTPLQLAIQLRKRRFAGLAFCNIDIDPAISDGPAPSVADQPAATENPADLAVARPADAVLHLERLGMVTENVAKSGQRHARGPRAGAAAASFRAAAPDRSAAGP